MTRLSNCALSLLFLITTSETKNKSFLSGGTEWGEGLSCFILAQCWIIMRKITMASDK